MSTTFSLNRDQVLQRALRLVGVLGEGEVPTTEMTNDAAEAFNVLVKNLEIIGLPLWVIKKKTFSLTLGKVEYDTTVDLAMDKPLKITNAIIHDTLSNTDIPMTEITRDEYNRLGNKNSTGIPVQIWYQPLQTNGLITIYPSPNQQAVDNKQIYFYYQKPFNDLLLAGDIPDFPSEWIRPLSYLLASDLAEEFSIPEEKKRNIQRKADKLLEDTLGFGMEDGSVFISPERVGR